MCNINTAEVAYRRKAMWFGIGLSAALLVAFLFSGLVWWAGAIALFIPVYIAAIGFLQVRNKFCVSYGANGRQNASEGSDAALAVEDKEALKADKLKTRKMNLQALAITLAALAVAAGLLYVL